MSLPRKNRKAKFLYDNSYKYAIQGSLLGLLIVVLTYTLFFLSVQYPFDFSSLKSIHSNNPFIYIIDFLPLLTSVGAFYIAHSIQIDKISISKELDSKNLLINKRFYF